MPRVGGEFSKGVIVHVGKEFIYVHTTEYDFLGREDHGSGAASRDTLKVACKRLYGVADIYQPTEHDEGTAKYGIHRCCQLFIGYYD